MNKTKKNYVDAKYQGLYSCVTWVRLSIFFAIICNITSLLLLFVTMDVWPYIFSIILLPFLIFLPGGLNDFFNNIHTPNLGLIYSVETIGGIAIALSLFFRIVALIKIKKTDTYNETLNQTRTLYSILMFFFPIIMGIIYLTKLSYLDLDNQKADAEKLATVNVANAVTIDSKTIIEKKLKNAKSNIIFNSVLYVLIILTIICIVIWGNDASAGVPLILLFLIVQVMCFVAIILWIANAIRDAKIDYGIASLNQKRKANAILTAFFRITGYFIWTKQLKKALSELNQNPQSSINIVQEWTDENNTHWGIDVNGKYYWKSNDDWNPY